MLVEKHVEVYADALYLSSDATAIPFQVESRERKKRQKPNVYLWNKKKTHNHSIWWISASAEFSLPLEVITFLFY